MTLASCTRTAYNKIPVFYHLPFAFTETNSKMSLFQHLVFLASINCFFLFIYLHIVGDLLKILLPLDFSITLLNSHYFYWVWEDIVNDLDRI